MYGATTDRTIRPPTGLTQPAAAPRFRNLRQFANAFGRGTGASEAGAHGTEVWKWGDIARDVFGISDFRGARKDPRFRDIQDATNNQINSGDSPERLALQQRAQQYIASHPGGFGGAGGAGGGAAGGGGSDTGNDYAGQISSTITGLLSGGIQPYGQDTIDRLKASAFEDAAGGVEAAKRGVAQRAARTGGLYSASAGSAAAEAEQAGRTDYSQAARGIEQAANEQNFSARMQGLTHGLALLQQEREERMANARNAVERESIRSQYDGLIKSTQLKIDADREALDKQLRASAGAAGAGYRNQRDILELQHQWDLENRAYEENWRLFNAIGGSLGGDDF